MLRIGAKSSAVVEALPFIAFVVQIDVTPIAAELAELMLLRVRAEGLRGYEAFLTDKRTKIPDIASIQSSISLRRIKGAS